MTMTDMDDQIGKAVESVKEKCSAFSAPACTGAICDMLISELLKSVCSARIRDNQIVGTPFGPDLAEGQYVYVGKLPSQGGPS